MSDFLRYDPAGLPERLRRLRKAKKMSLACLGDLCGVGRSAIVRYERGQRWPNAKTLCRLAEALDTSVDALLGGKA